MVDVPKTGQANLIPWQKGQSGNPAGKPKGARNRQTIVREILEMLVDEVGEDGQKTGKKIKAVEAMTRAQLIKALSGDVNSFKELMDSGFGKVVDKVETSHTFTQMGKVVAEDQKQAAISDQSQENELTFDVGSPLPVIEAEAEEVSNEQEAD